MKTITSNYNGKVIKTATAAFKVKKHADFIVSMIEDMGGETWGYEQAGTGSVYFDAEIKGIRLNIRVADHTKRVSDMYEVYTIKQDRMFPHVYDVQVLDKKSFNEVVTFLKSK